MLFSLLAVVLLIGPQYVGAVCDNLCSGRGTCQTDDVCKCYDNWGVGLTHQRLLAFNFIYYSFELMQYFFVVTVLIAFARMS